MDGEVGTHGDVMTWSADEGPSRQDRRRGQYHAFIPEPLGTRDLRVPPDLVGGLTGAAESVRALQHAYGPEGLESIARLLLRSEAVASSWTEGIYAGPRRIALAQLDLAAGDRTAQEVVANIRATEAAIGNLAALSVVTADDVAQIHAELMQPRGEEATPGKTRRSPVWIGRSSTPLDASYVPPRWERVSGLMDDLGEFLSRTDLPPVFQAGVAHAQLETIHPFADGNGRTGRALIQAVLARHGLATPIPPPVSLVLSAWKNRYVQGLVDFREQNLSEWLRFFALCVKRAAEEGGRLGRKAEALQQQWLQRAGYPRRESTARKVILGLFACPVMNVASISQRYGVSDEAARLALMSLERKGLVKQQALRNRNRVWTAPEVFSHLIEWEAGMRELPVDDPEASGAESPIRDPKPAPG